MSVSYGSVLRVERIAHMKSGETGEVSVGGPQLVHSMFDHERRDVRVVREVAGGLACLEQPLHECRMPRSFLKQRERRRLEQ